MPHFSKLAFLDRDGTLNPDPGYLNHPDQLALFPGVPDALSRLRSAGFGLVVVTNQSGVGRGLIQPQVLPRIHARMNELLLQAGGVTIDHFAICIHRPEEECDCRKPKPFLLHQAAQMFSASIAASVMIGDRISDITAGKRAGCRASVQVLTGVGQEEAKKVLTPLEAADYQATDLGTAVEWILKTSQD